MYNQTCKLHEKNLKWPTYSYAITRSSKPSGGVGALNADETANGGTRYEVNAGVDIYLGGTATITSGKVSSITNPGELSTAQQRELIVKQWLQEMESVPVGNWGLARNFENSLTRARNCWKWIEGIGAHSSKSVNLTTAARWTKIQNEMKWTMAKWYKEHNVSRWDALSIDTLAQTWYGTNTGNGLPVADSSFSGYAGSGNDKWEGLVQWIYN